MKLSIPAPPGYALVTDDMKPYAQLVMRFVPPGNQQFALFVSTTDAAVAAQGVLPKAERRFVVQSAKELIPFTFTIADFAELKRTLKSQNAEILKEVQANSPALFASVNKGIIEDYKKDPNISLNQMVPFAAHYETESALAYSTLMRLNGNDKNGQPYVWVGVTTSTDVYLKGKVLFLIVYAEEKGMEWSRTASKEWAEMIVAMNSPSKVDIGVLGMISYFLRRTNWLQVGNRTLIVFLVAIVLSLLGYVIRNKKL